MDRINNPILAKKFIKKAEEFAYNKLGHVKPLNLKRQNRNREYSRARFLVWYTLNKKYNMNASQIADIYQRDHSTVVDGIRRAVELRLV